MSDKPSQAIYKCPQHGIFMVEAGEILAKELFCPIRIMMKEGGTFPCGTLSPLCKLDDPDLNTQPITGLDGDSLATLRESVAQLKEQRRQQAAEGRELADDKPNYIFGGDQNRRNGRPITRRHEAVVVDPDQAEFETSERERMRAAMSEEPSGTN